MSRCLCSAHHGVAHHLSTQENDLVAIAESDFRQLREGRNTMWAKAIMILLVIILSAGWASAQSTFGDVVGVVKDQNQGGVPGAQILLTSVDDASQHQTTSDADGAFHFVNLKAGNYDLVISAAGFSDFKISSAHLDARQTLRLDVAMKLASASQSIEVEARGRAPKNNKEEATHRSPHIM